MSTDDLRRHLTRDLDFLRALQSRGLPPVSCVMAWLDGDPPPPDYTLRHPHPLPVCTPSEAVTADALFHPRHHITEPYRVATHIGTGGQYVTVLTTTPTLDPMAEWQQLPTAAPHDDRYRRGLEAIGVVEQVRNRLSGIVRSLPPRLVDRLGLDRYSRTSDWLAVVFHLGWHFPAHGIEAGRYRILSAAKHALGDFFCGEMNLQLGDVRVSPDVYPGVMLSRLADSSDAVSCGCQSLRTAINRLKIVESERRLPEVRRTNSQ